MLTVSSGISFRSVCLLTCKFHEQEPFQIFRFYPPTWRFSLEEKKIPTGSMTSSCYRANQRVYLLIQNSLLERILARGVESFRTICWSLFSWQ